MQVIFGVHSKRVTVDYDRSRLSLGAIVYASDSAEGTRFHPEPTATARPFVVTWISPSEWYVVLSDGLPINDRDVARICSATGGLIDETTARLAYERCCKKIPLQSLYLSRALEESGLNQLMTVVDRLDLVDRLSTPDVGKALFHHHEALVVYLLLTCFDRLGQPANWKSFVEWLDSPEPGTVVVPKGSPIEQAKFLHSQYSARYGVRSSFFHFLNDVLPEDALHKLLSSFDIDIMTNPPTINQRQANEQEKKEWLFRARNNYTHNAQFIPGVHAALRPSPEPARTTIGRQQIFEKREWKSLETRNWPAELRMAVRSGLAALVKQIATDQAETPD